MAAPRAVATAGSVLALLLAVAADAEPAWQGGAECIYERLTLSGSFPGGALDGCLRTAPNAFTLAILPERAKINPSPWYAFEITSEAPRHLSITLDYGNYKHRYSPKVARNGGVDGKDEWSPLATEVITSDGRTQARFTVDVPAGTIRIAAQEVVTLEDESRWVRKMEESTPLEAGVLGMSAEGRRIPMLSGGTPRLGSLVIVGRQHPPEVTGAHALHAFVARLAESDPLAFRFRKCFALLVVPILNPDGVAHGHWRLDTAGTDLNRDWGPFERPETRLVRNALSDLAARGAAPALIVDFHSTDRDALYTQPDDADGARPWFPRAWHTAINARLDGPPLARKAGHNPENTTLKSWAQGYWEVPAITYEMGDATSRTRIARMARIAAEEAMRLLLEGPEHSLSVPAEGVTGAIFVPTAGMRFWSVTFSSGR